MNKDSAWYAVFVKTGEEDKVKARLDYRFDGSLVVVTPKK